MASLNDIGMGIGDFAQALLEQELTNPQPKSKPVVKGNTIDISEVVVSKEDVDSVLQESFGVSKKEKPKVDLEEQKNQQIREEIKETIAKLKSLLNQLPLEERTTVGNIGVNMATVTDGKPSKHYKATTRRKVSQRKR